MGLRRDARPAARGDARVRRATRASTAASTKWIWRCHIDLTDANPTVWEFFRPLRRAVRRVGVDDAASSFPRQPHDGRRRVRAAVHRPALGEEPRPAATRSSRRSASSTACGPHDPLIVQVSRFDPWKDPIGVIEAFRIVREEFPNAQLVLAGSMATDDPEGFHYWELADEARAGDPDIHLLSNIQQVGVGADQRVPTRRRRRDAEVAARGIRPHRERRAVEGPARRRRPLRRHHAADRGRRERLPRRPVEEAAAAHRRAAARTRPRPTRWAPPAASTSATTSCRPASSRTGCGCSAISSVAAMIVVSHRGPYRFERDRRRHASRPSAARAASSARSAPCSTRRRRRDLDRGRDLRRRPRGRRVGRARRPRRRPPPARRSIPSCTRCTTTSCRTACCGSCFHGLFDRIAAPALRPPLPRGVGRVRRTVNDGVRRGDRRGRGATATSCSCKDYQLVAASARSCAQLRPDLRVVHFTHTPFCGPDEIRVLPDRRGRVELCDVARGATRPASTPTRWAACVPAVGHATMLGARRDDRASRSRRASAPTSTRSRRSRRATKPHAAADALDDVVGDRLVIVRSDRIEPSKNIVRGFLAYDRLLEARPGLRGRVVFVAMLYPSRSRCPSTSRTRTRSSRSSRASTSAGRRATGRRSCSTSATTSPARSPAMQRYDVLLVNPIKDGLNLVAKEGPVVNRRDGVLCLSPRGRRVRRAAATRRSRCTRTTSRRRRARSTPRSRRRSTSGRRSPSELRDARDGAHAVRLARPISSRTPTERTRTD